MKPNKYLKPEQQDYIDKIVLTTDTKGMNAGVAHKITITELTIKNIKDALTHANDRFEMMTQKHNDNGFDMLVKNVEYRDGLING